MIVAGMAVEALATPDGRAKAAIARRHAAASAAARAADDAAKPFTLVCDGLEAMGGRPMSAGRWPRAWRDRRFPADTGALSRRKIHPAVKNVATLKPDR